MEEKCGNAEKLKARNYFSVSVFQRFRFI